RFDEWHEAEIGRREKHPTIQLDFPPGLTAVLNALRQRADDAARWIAFALLDLSPGAVSQMERDLEEVRKNARPDGRTVRTTFQDGNVVVTIMAARALSAQELNRQAVFRVNIEKYRRQASASLLIAINADEP